MRRALMGVAALSGLLMVAACGSDDDDVDTSIPAVDSVLDSITPEDSAGPMDTTMTPGDTSMTGITTASSPMDTTMTSDTASSATVAP